MKHPVATLAAAALLLGTGSAVMAQEAEMQLIRELQHLVEQQRLQLAEQSRRIEELEQRLNAVAPPAGTATPAAASPPVPAASAPPAPARSAQAASRETAAEAPGRPAVTSSRKTATVRIYGQVNRAFLWADNGDASRGYFVDNHNSSTRMGLAATARPGGGSWSMGGKLEYEIYSNFSDAVNQIDESTSMDLDLRHADLFLANPVLGKLSLGQGSTATDGVSERDLSGTSVAASSPVYYLGGGQYWFDSASGSLAELQVKDVFTNMDGLSRRDRVRYDSPSLAGFTLSGAAIEQGAFDAALGYSRKFSGLKLAGALGWASPGDIISGVDNQYNGSLSLLLDNGLNLSLAGGIRDFAEQGRSNAEFWYAKLGWRARPLDWGTTALSMDYGQFRDIAAADDDADTWALALVQHVDAWSTEFYLAWRMFSLDRPGADFDDVSGLMSGARIKF